MHSILYWISLIELLSFAIAIVFFLKFSIKGKNSKEAEELHHQESNLALIFMFLPHVFRGMYGLTINRLMPRSHHIIDQMDVGSNEKGHL